MRAYIDESGDAGIGRGTRWLVFGMGMLGDGDVVSAEGVLQKALSEIFGEKNKHYFFHFSGMGHSSKLAAYEYFVTAPWIGCLLARDTTEARSLPPDFRPEVALYTQMVSYLLEVVSRRAAHLQEEATIYIGARDINRSTLPRFLAYVQQEVDRGALGIDSRWISMHRIHVIDVVEQMQHVLFGLADGLAHAGHSALEPHSPSPRREEHYYRVVVQKLWGRDPLHGVNVYDHGLLFRPKRRWPEFLQEYPWLVLS